MFTACAQNAVVAADVIVMAALLLLLHPSMVAAPSWTSPILVALAV